MRTIRLRLATALLGALLVPLAGAQTAATAPAAVPESAPAAPVDPAYRAVVLDLLEHLRTEAHLQNLRTAMVERELRRDKRLEEHAEVLAQHLDKYMAWEVVRDDIVAAYTTQFDAAEVREVLDFYRSPVGMKVLMHLERLNQAAFVKGVERARENMPELRYRLLEEQQQSAPPPAAPSAPAADPPKP